LVNQATKEQFACIFNVEYDNERYTQAALPTNNDDPVNGEILLTESGLYTYTIYGQNSDSNLDPTDASVVGVCEIGPCKVSDEPAWTIPNVSIPDNVIYYE
jgi:beta-glucanase (GH16 family)